MEQAVAVAHCLHDGVYLNPTDAIGDGSPLESLVLDLAIFGPGARESCHEVSLTFVAAGGAMEEWKRFLTPPVDPRRCPSVPLEALHGVIREGAEGMRLLEPSSHADNPYAVTESSVLLNARHLHWEVLLKALPRILNQIPGEVPYRSAAPFWANAVPAGYPEALFHHLQMEGAIRRSGAAVGTPEWREMKGRADSFWFNVLGPLYFQVAQSRIVEIPLVYREGRRIMFEVEHMEMDDPHGDPEFGADPTNVIPELDQKTVERVLEARAYKEFFSQLPVDQALTWLADRT